MKKTLLLVAVMFVTAFVFSQETIKAMTYNVVKFAPSSSTDRQLAHEYIYNDIKPDLLMVQEAGINTPDHILGKLNTIENKYLRTTRFNNISNPSDDNGQLVFYNKNIFELVEEKALAASTRNINQYTFRFKKLDINENPVYLEVFVAHLKSSDGRTNSIERNNQISTFIQALNTVDQSRYIILAGDLNLYTSNEAAYINALNGTASIKMKDPIGNAALCETIPVIDADGSFSWSTYFPTSPTSENIKYFWRDNINFSSIHTQNPRISSGGLDDRFDFILVSENLMNENSNLSYIPNTYLAYGNNGNCLNKDVTDASCTGSYSAVTRQHVNYASDHLPVVMDFQFKSSTLSTYNYSISSISFASSNVTNSSILLNINERILNSELLIYNQLGQVVKSVLIGNQTGLNKQLNIDVSNLHSGVYFITIKSNNLAKPLKFIKN